MSVIALIERLRTRIANTVVRVVVKAVKDSQQIQELQVEMLASEVREDVERIQDYGFTSNPKPDAEGIAVCVDGRRGHSVIIAVDDRRYRIGNLESGEVAVYDCTGSKMLFKSNGDIEVTPSSGKTAIVGDVTVSGTLDVSGAGTIGGALDVSGDVNSSATITGSTDVVGGGKSLKSHKHDQGTLAGTQASPVGPVTITGDTGTPS